jgi:hypothetical protein
VIVETETEFKVGFYQVYAGPPVVFKGEDFLWVRAVLPKPRAKYPDAFAAAKRLERLHPDKYEFLVD